MASEELEWWRGRLRRSLDAYAKNYGFAESGGELTYYPPIYEPSPKTKGNLLAFEQNKHGERGHHIGTLFKVRGGWKFFFHLHSKPSMTYSTLSEAKQQLAELDEISWCDFWCAAWD